MELEIKIIVKVTTTDTLADVRSKLCDPNGIFMVNNTHTSARIEGNVTCLEIVEASSPLEWVSEKSATQSGDDTSPQDFYDENAKHASSVTVEETQVSARRSLDFQLPALRQNFAHACKMFQELVQKNPHHIGHFVVIFQQMDGTLDHKFLDVKTFQEAFVVIRQDSEIDKSKAPFVVLLDPEAGMSSRSVHYNWLRKFNPAWYDSKNSVHQTAFLAYKKSSDRTYVIHGVGQLVIDTGCALTHLFSMKHLVASTLNESVFALDYMTTISCQTMPILLVDGLDLKLELEGPEWISGQLVSVALDRDLFNYLMNDSSQLDHEASKRFGQDKVTNLLQFCSQLLLFPRSNSPEERARLDEELQKFGILSNMSDGSLNGVIGKALMDAYVYYSNGPEHGGIRFASKSCRVRAFDAQGTEITRARFQS